jgi:protease YdgD
MRRYSELLREPRRAPVSRRLGHGLVRAALLALLAFPGALPAESTNVQPAPLEGAMPPLDRDVAAGLGAIGRINRAGFRQRSHCTGALIRPDVVLTAAHCARQGDETGAARPIIDPARRKVFVAGYDRGEFLAFREIVAETRHPAYGIASVHDPRFDIGLLFLESPITEVAPLPLVPSAEGETVALAGYHRFIRHALTGRLDCPVWQRVDTLLWIGCPVFSGNSGGPVLVRGPEGEWQVAGVVSSTLGATKGALAVLLPDWVTETLDAR